MMELSEKLVTFWGRPKCMIPNVNNVMFLALVPALQWTLHHHFLIYVRSK